MDNRKVDGLIAEHLFGWIIESTEHGWPPAVV